MIALSTSRFGDIQVEEEEIFNFPKGIPGFEDKRGFIIVASEEDRPFSYLQSVEDPDLMFVIVDPFMFLTEYEFELPASALSELSIESIGQVIIRSIINVPDKPAQATVNLAAPLVINVDTGLAKQVVLNHSLYSTKHPLFGTGGKG